MKTKTFDCVEMKRKAQEGIYEETKDLTYEELVAYWEEKNKTAREVLQSFRHATDDSEE